MLNSASNLIKLKKLEQNSVRVKEKWCSEQEEDFKRMVCLVDDLVAHAISAGNSSHSYAELQSAKENFLDEFIQMAEKYSLVIK